MKNIKNIIYLSATHYLLSLERFNPIIEVFKVEFDKLANPLGFYWKFLLCLRTYHVVNGATAQAHIGGCFLY